MTKNSRVTSLLCSTLLRSSIIRKIWEIVREQVIIIKHERVARFWWTVIEPYRGNNIDLHCASAKTAFLNEKIIWQYWGQGLNDEVLPEVVKICFDSVDKFKGDYRVVRLTDNSIREYIDFPEFVWRKRKNPKFKPVFFSDLLRLALLQAYGGIWLDATVLLTAQIPVKLKDMRFFAYQRSKFAEDKAIWKRLHPYYWNWNPRFKVNVLSSVFIGTKGEPLIVALLHFMLQYWKTQAKIINYFFLQILFDELVKGDFRRYNCETMDDTLPHLLQSKILKHQNRLSYKEIFDRQSLHKLTYFSGSELRELKEAVKHLDLQSPKVS